MPILTVAAGFPLLLELLQILHKHMCPICLMKRDITIEEFVCHLDPAFDEAPSGEEEQEEDAPPMLVPDKPLPALPDATAMGGATAPYSTIAPASCSSHTREAPRWCTKAPRLH
jgi:hypothetical protein